MKFSLRHQSAGWLYPYIVPTGHWMFYGLFRNVFVYNRHGVPSDRPVLLASNHPTAFIDPFLLTVFIDPPLYNMTRGDIFKKPFFRRFLESINMFPVFRVRDGYVQRDRNDDVFEFCLQKLQERRVVTIYVEGEHHLEKRVRPAQKGLARIAFSAYERHALDDLVVIPVGCNYWKGDIARDRAYMVVGQPLLVQDYWAKYRESPAAAVSQLSADVEQGLKQVCFHIADPQDDRLSEQLLTLYRGDHPAPLLPVEVFSGRRFFEEKAVLDRVNSLSAPEKNELARQVDAYFEKLNRAGLDDAALVNAPRWRHPAWWLVLTLGLAPFLLGWLSSYPIGWVARRVTRKNVRKRELFSSVLLAVAYLFSWPYYLLFILAALFTLQPVWIGLAFSLPFLGWFALWYGEAWQRFWAAGKAGRHRERAILLAERKNLEDFFQDLK